MVNWPRDKVIGKTEKGGRIFAYNDKGRPICFSKRPGRKDANGDNLRCQSTLLMPNGRCSKHGGKAVGGIMHWNAQHLRSSANLPGRLQGDMERAFIDPDYLSSKHEIALDDVHIAQLKEGLDGGIDEPTWKRAKKLADALEDALENDPEASETICNELIEVIRFGSKEVNLWKEYHAVEESRRKNVETASKREIQLKQLLKGEQAIALVTSLASYIREGIAKVINDIEKKYVLIDRETQLEVSHIDNQIKNDFLVYIHEKLAALINKTKAPLPGEEKNLG